MKKILKTFGEKILYGFGFGTGMTFSFCLFSKNQTIISSSDKSDGGFKQ